MSYEKHKKLVDDLDAAMQPIHDYVQEIKESEPEKATKIAVLIVRMSEALKKIGGLTP